MFGLPLGTALLVIVLAIFFLMWIKILNAHERGVVFRLGRLLREPKGPGLHLAFNYDDCRR